MGQKKNPIPFFCQIYSEEKAKLLRDIMAKIDGKSETLE